MSELSIEHVPGQGFFIDAGGQRLAEMTYEKERPGVIVLDHTWVSGELRGQGMARRLLDALVAWARESQTRVVPTCSYAVKVFREDPSIRDVLAS